MNGRDSATLPRPLARRVPGACWIARPPDPHIPLGMLGRCRGQPPPEAIDLLERLKVGLARIGCEPAQPEATRPLTWCGGLDAAQL